MTFADDASGASGDKGDRGERGERGRQADSAQAPPPPARTVPIVSVIAAPVTRPRSLMGPNLDIVSIFTSHCNNDINCFRSQLSPSPFAARSPKFGP